VKRSRCTSNRRTNPRSWPKAASPRRSRFDRRPLPQGWSALHRQWCPGTAPCYNGPTNDASKIASEAGPR
jgi:hypothetical protein